MRIKYSRKLLFGVRLLSGIFGKKKRLNARVFAREFLQKMFLFGGCGFFVSDFISGGLLGHLGLLCLALGANR